MTARLAKPPTADVELQADEDEALRVHLLAIQGVCEPCSSSPSDSRCVATVAYSSVDVDLQSATVAFDVDYLVKINAAR